MSSPIESRRRPQFDAYGRPASEEPPIFRLPLPPTQEILRSAVPLFVRAFFFGVALLLLAPMQAHAPRFVTFVLVACCLTNLGAAAMRYLSAKTNVTELLRFAGYLAVCYVFIGFGRDLYLGQLAVILLVLICAAVAQHLVQGMTAADALGWAGTFFVLLVALNLPYRLSLNTAYYVVFIPIAGLNSVLAWLMGYYYARYYLADPALSPAQVAAAEELRKEIYTQREGDRVGLWIGVVAWPLHVAWMLALFSLILAWVLPYEEIFADEKTWAARSISTGDLNARIAELNAVMCAMAISFWAAANPLVEVVSWPSARLWISRESWRAWRSSPPLAAAHLLWFAYDDHATPAAGAGTFRFPKWLASASVRRLIYGSILIVNMLSARMFLFRFDADVDVFSPEQWVYWMLTFLSPLLAPFGLTVLFHAGPLVSIQKKLEEEADHV